MSSDKEELVLCLFIVGKYQEKSTEVSSTLRSLPFDVSETFRMHSRREQRRPA